MSSCQCYTKSEVMPPILLLIITWWTMTSVGSLVIQMDGSFCVCSLSQYLWFFMVKSKCSLLLIRFIMKCFKKPKCEDNNLYMIIMLQQCIELHFYLLKEFDLIKKTLIDTFIVMVCLMVCQAYTKSDVMPSIYCC